MKNKFLYLSVLVFALTSCQDEKQTLSTLRIDALDNSAWESSAWISAVDAPVIEGIVLWDNPSADGSSWFLSTVKNEKNVESAKWMTTGLGVYELYVNGQLVGNEVLKPGFTHYQKTKLSFTYDVTSLIDVKKDGNNEFSAQVTPGWWADKIVTPDGHDGMIGNKCAFRAVLELTYTDGTKKLFGTDTENWTAGIAGPVTHASIFDGEEYDARILPGYSTPDKLSAPEINDEFNGEIVPSNGAEVYLRHDLALSPVQAYVWNGVEGESENEYGKIVVTKKYKAGEAMKIAPGETLVVDFGQNAAAVPSFVFEANEGTKLVCLPAELVNDGNGSKNRGMDGPEGSVHRLNLRAANRGMHLYYIFANAGEAVSFIPQSTFFGYRYVSITADAEVTIHSIKSIPVTSIAADMEIGTIATGNDLINRLISNTLWGQRSNYLSVPTDCPQRNERLGWTADTQVFTETGSFFANTAGFFHKWMRDMRDTQSPLGGFPGVAPIGQYGNEMMRVGWADAGVIVPWTIWKQFGDTKIVDECWASMEKYINHVNETKYDHATLAEENQNYQNADWLSYEPYESRDGKLSDKNGYLPEVLDYWNFLSASYWVIDAAMMRDMAAATGRDVAKFDTMVAEAKSYIRDKFFDAEGTFKTTALNTMQTPVLFALKNEIFEGEAKDKMIARLRQNFAEHGNCLQTGFLGTSILLPTLSKNGMGDIAYELLLQRKNPSWLYSIDNGATTIWERWNSFTIEHGMGRQDMNSFNHYAYGVVCQWIWENAAGIAADTAAPGFKHIIMSPMPDKRLGHIDAEYNSAAGLIKSSWKYEGDKWIWNFTIPQGATATVTVPGESDSKDYEAGSYTITI